MTSTESELNDQLQNGTAGLLMNQTPASMQLIRSHSWSGNFSSVPRPIISQGGVFELDHRKGNDQVSEAAVSYTITSRTGVALAVILAWSAPANFNSNTSPNKIFGACGPRSLIDSLTWDQIQMLLINAGPSVNMKNDGVCGGGPITYNPTAGMANIVAVFRSC